MKKAVFWMGVAVLVVGVVVFAYGLIIVQDILALASSDNVTLSYLFRGGYYEQWRFAHILQPIGLGMLVLGAIMMAYGALVKQ